MARIILVDDSAGARALLGVRLREQGHEVVDMRGAAEAAELALAKPPQAIVTDLWMPGISGLQLCRLLRAEPVTAQIPIVLLTATDDRRSRFWAKHAGATAYVTKTEIDRLIAVLADVAMAVPPAPPSSPTTSPRGTVQERLSQLLDAALYESTIAGQVRAMAQDAEDIERLFDDLAALASDVVGYRWMAVVLDPGGRLLIHTHTGMREISEREARDAFGTPAPPERRRAADAPDAVIVADVRAIEADWSTPPILLPITFGSVPMGRIALAPSRRGASHEDRKLVGLLAAELGGPLRMVALIAESRRLASTDSLTGLLNRRAFIEAIEKARAADPKFFPVSMLMLDVDHFKKVNDTHGHDGGDAVLQGVGKVLTHMARKSDLVARWGGEEFVVALAKTAEGGARIAAERVRRALADAKHALPNGETLTATASVGLASAAAVDWDLEGLIARADRAMYAAKHRGRNRVETA